MMVNEMLQEAWESLKVKDLKKAHEQFNQVLITTDDEQVRYEAKFGLGLTFRDIGELDEALKLMKESIELSGEPKEAIFAVGNLYEEIGNYALAIQNFDIAISMDPTNVDAYINRGVSWYNLGDLEQSLRDFRNALQQDKTNSRALSNIGTVFLRQNKYEKAIDNFDQSLSMDEKNIHSLCGKGLALYYLDRYDDSMICFDAASTINPDFYIAHYYKGHILRKLDLLDEAEEAIRTALKLRREYPLAWFELGEILRMKNLKDEAIKAYDRAIKTNQGIFEEAHFQKGRILFDRKDYRKALSSYIRILKNNKYVPDVWLEMARCLIMLESDESKIVASLKNVLYLEPSSSEASRLLANIYSGKGEKDKAMRILKESMEKAPEATNGLLLSKLLYELGRFKDCINMAENVISLDPELFEAYLPMGRSYGAMGKTEEYKQCLRKYLHKSPEDVDVKKEMDGL